MRVKFILFLCCFLAACAPAPEPLTGTIVCFGDSITFGTGADQHASYPSVLAQALKSPVANAGVAGDTTADALARVERDVLNQHPFLVIIELGGNDYMRGVPRHVTVSNLEAIVTRIKKSGAKIFLCDIASSLALGEYSGVFEDLCRRTGAVFIPGVMRGVLDDDTKKSDELHPNAAGYQIIAQRIADILKQHYQFNE
jgi:acyl-CoA thioesterase I